MKKHTPRRRVVLIVVQALASLRKRCSNSTLIFCTMIKHKQTKIAKTLLLAGTLTTLCSQQGIAQSRDVTSIDLLAGYSEKAGIALGYAIRNIGYTPFGIYFQGQIFNDGIWFQPYDHDDHFNSSFGWKTYYDTTVTKLRPYGYSGGVTLNVGRIAGKRNLGLTLMLGVGSIRPDNTKYEYKERREYYNTLLSDSYRTSGEVKEAPSKLVYEVMVAYDVIGGDKPCGLSLIAGYNTGGGAHFGLGLGIRTGSEREHSKVSTTSNQ